jgi:hypothetical protein
MKICGITHNFNVAYDVSHEIAKGNNTHNIVKINMSSKNHANIMFGKLYATFSLIRQEKQIYFFIFTMNSSFYFRYTKQKIQKLQKCIDYILFYEIFKKIILLENSKILMFLCLYHPQLCDMKQQKIAY